jgi:hypothetical protein
MVSYADRVEEILNENNAVLTAITVFELFNGVTKQKASRR